MSSIHWAFFALAIEQQERMKTLLFLIAPGGQWGKADHTKIE